MSKLQDYVLVRLAAAVLSGFLWMLCFEPFGLPVTGFIAFVPWFFALKKMSRIEVIAGSLIVSGFLSFGNLGWISHLNMGGFAAVVVYFWLSTMILGFAVKYAHKKGFGFSALIIVSTLVSLEVIRTYINLPLTFPWLKLGYSQSNFIEFAQIADIGGAYLVSGVLIFINWTLARFLSEICAGYKRKLLLIPAYALILFIIVFLYGVLRINQVEAEKVAGPTVALVQPNRVFPSRAGQSSFRTMNKLAKSAVTKADIIAIPETMLYSETAKMVDGKPVLTKFGQYWVNDIFGSAKEPRAQYIVGGITLETVEENKYLNGAKYKTNSAIIINNKGEILDYYSKIGLVPIGEYVPYLSLSLNSMKIVGPGMLLLSIIIIILSLAFRKKFKRILQKRVRIIIWIFISLFAYCSIILTGSAYLKDLMIAGFANAGLGEEYIPNDKPGERFTKFISEIPEKNAEKTYKFVTPICYELAYPEILRHLNFSDEIEADFILNLSNDNFYKKSAELDQMLNMARFRCIENRKAMGRCTTTGISAFVSATGKIVDFIEIEGEKKEVEGMLIREISVHKGRSIYNKLGDWFAWLCFAVFCLIFIIWIYNQKDT